MGEKAKRSFCLPSTCILFKGNNDLDVWKGALDPYAKTGTTVLVKVHSLVHATRLFTGCNLPGEFMNETCPVDLAIYSHRDLTPQVASLKRMGWGQAINERLVMEDTFEFCRKTKNHYSRKKPFLTDEEWSDPLTWQTQALALAKCHEEWLSAAGSKLILDNRMEGTLTGTVQDRIALAERIVAEIQAIDEQNPTLKPFSLMDPDAAVAEADALRPLSCRSWQAVNPLTHFHRGHVVMSNTSGQTSAPKNDEQVKRDQDAYFHGKATLEAHPYVKQWRKSRGYI